MRIGIDFDGVVANTSKIKTDLVKHLFGLDIPPDKFKKDFLFGEKILTLEQYRELQRSVHGTRELGLLMEPVEGALYYIPRLLDDGYDLTVVTSRYDVSLDIAKEWAWMQGLNIPFVGTGYESSKLEAAKDMDVFMDDDLFKLEPLVGTVPNLFIFIWGYNKHINEKGIAERVYSWAEFYEKIRDISEITTLRKGA